MARNWNAVRQIQYSGVSAGNLSVEGHRPVKPPSMFATWLLMIGVFVPSNMTVFIGDAKFTPGRIAICLLLPSALFLLFRKGRHLVAADIFVLAASVWMVAVILMTGRYSSLSSSVAEMLEFGGGYLVVRGYFFGRPALDAFIHTLKIVTIAIVVCAALEQITSSYLITNIVASVWGDPSTGPDFRNGLLRARSTFPHPILYGAFCAIAGTIFLYSESRGSNRFFYVGFCFVGCIFAMSSAPLISFAVAVGVYCYDRLLRKNAWRWKALMTVIFSAIAVVFMVANRPTSWLVANLTLDPSTGYFRQATWDRALYNIGESPITGYGFDAFGDPNEFFDRASIDSIWLVVALRFGVPMVIFILLACITACMRTGGPKATRDSYMDRMRTAFTLVLVVFALAGLTVHFWHSLWVFWGMCIGMRACLREDYFSSARRSFLPSQTALSHASLSLR